MKSLVILAALFAAAVAVSVSKKAPLLNEDSPTCIEDEYIVVFEDEIADELVQQHFSLLNNLIALDGKSTNKVLHQYHIGPSFRGYSAHIDKSILDQVRDMKEVKYVERNMEVKAFQERCNEQSISERGLWGLVRTVNRDRYELPDSKYLYADADGLGVDVYILDTGIYINHKDFEGRAKAGADFVGEGGTDDGNGHGTHCAGTVMSKTYGLAKKATAIAVKVLGSSGSGSFEGVIAGIDWVAAQSGIKVASMSLGGGRHDATNAAVEAAIEQGVHFSIAAGNNAGDGCYISPGSADGAIGVAASDIYDDLAYFSNYGGCTEIIAPGVDVLSTWIGGDDRTNTISGTSMAAPHVAGVMAKILSIYDLTPAELEIAIKGIATKDEIDLRGKPFDHNDLLYFNDCIDN